MMGEFFFCFLGEYSWKRDESFSCDCWRIYWMEMEYVDEYYFLELDLLNRVYGEVFVVPREALGQETVQ